jgi:hypothetical protein
MNKNKLILETIFKEVKIRCNLKVFLNSQALIYLLIQIYRTCFNKINHNNSLMHNSDNPLNYHLDFSQIYNNNNRSSNP